MGSLFGKLHLKAKGVRIVKKNLMYIYMYLNISFHTNLKLIHVIPCLLLFSGTKEQQWEDKEKRLIKIV